MKDSVAAELAIKAQQGDMQAFEQLYIEFSPLIYSILLEITHDSYEAEDLTQDCFASALKNIHTLKDPAKIKKWLTAIAANHGKDYLKKKKPALLGSEHEYIFDIQEEKNEALLPEEYAVLDERGEEIREIVNSVSEDKRLCLVLFYQHEMSITEISEELGISESAVKSRLFRAREDIREEVEKRNKKGMPLFGIAPLPLILFALQKSSQTAAASFAGSAAQGAAFAGIAASQAGIVSAATASTAAGAAASTAGTTATAATGIGAKVAAMSVAQKIVAGVAAATIVTGSATVTTVVVKNKTESTTTTTYIEEVTTAPDYGFESETLFIPTVSQTESSTSGFSTRISTSAAKQSTTVSSTQTAKKSTIASKTSAASTVKNKTTTKKQTTTKPETTTATPTETTTKATTTKATTTKKETTTKNVATTTTTVKATTTTTKTVTTTTTTKAATTATEASSPATVTVTVWGEETSTTKTLYFEAGETITAAEIESRLSDEYGIEAIADDINITAEAGGSYTATAYE